MEPSETAVTIRQAFDADPSLINMGLLTIEPEPQFKCPQSTHDAYGVATLFERNYEDCLSYRTYLQSRNGQDCEDKKNAVDTLIEDNEMAFDAAKVLTDAHLQRGFNIGEDLLNEFEEFMYFARRMRTDCVEVQDAWRTNKTSSDPLIPLFGEECMPPNDDSMVNEAVFWINEKEAEEAFERWLEEQFTASCNAWCKREYTDVIEDPANQ